MFLRASLLFTVFFGFLFSCKKYPEDPFISIYSAKTRLKNSWKIRSIKVNEVDVTGLYSDSVGLDITGLEIQNLCIKDDKNSDKPYWLADFTDSGKGIYHRGFLLSKNKRLMEFDMSPTAVNSKSTSLHRIYSINNGSWKVLRLFGGKFKIETHDNGVRYEIVYDWN